MLVGVGDKNANDAAMCYFAAKNILSLNYIAANNTYAVYF